MRTFLYCKKTEILHTFKEINWLLLEHCLLYLSGGKIKVVFRWQFSKGSEINYLDDTKNFIKKKGNCQSATGRLKVLGTTETSVSFEKRVKTTNKENTI